METLDQVGLRNVPSEYLEAELVSHAAFETTGMARMIAVLGEFDRRGVWTEWECRSPQHWLNWKCGLGYVAGSERVRVARCIDQFPVISAHFAAGRLSWTKVRDLTRVATSENESRLCDIALVGTAAHVSRLVAAMRKVTRRQAVQQIATRSFNWTADVDGSVIITVRLPADAAMTVIAAVRETTIPEHGVAWSASAADAVVELIVGSAEVRPEVIVHLADDSCSFEDGLAVATEIAECLACDGPVTTVVDTPDGPVIKDRRKAPTKRQRRWLALRHQMCQFPGCHHTGRFDAHHVIERGKGGRTKLPNLTRLCGFHHRMVHLHRLVLTLHRDRRLEVRFPDGKLVDRPITYQQFVAPPSADPNLISGTWYGDRLDLGDALYALGIY